MLQTTQLSNSWDSMLVISTNIRARRTGGVRPCGSQDSLVWPAWVEDTRDRLAQLGVVVVTQSTVPGLQRHGVKTL